MIKLEEFRPDHDEGTYYEDALVKLREFELYISPSIAFNMERFYGTVHDSIELRSTFSGDFMDNRTTLLRHNIETVRKKWVDAESYGELVEVVRSIYKLENLPEEVSELLLCLLEGYRDYADVDLGRPQKMIAEQYATLELYCSEKGHGYLFKVMGEALRKENASEDVLLAATILLEFLTIDLYNLRLSQIGDSRYNNFQGVVYRGMSVTSSMVDEYKHILAQPDLRKRNFAVPLSLFSASTDRNVMKTISKCFRTENRVQMHWEIHVYGLDPLLLEAYQAQFPSSIVTSICAMPIARVSPFAEKEVLLRGAYFHLIEMHEKIVDEQKVIHLIMVMINANRDHTTEEASHLDRKKYQREAFARIVLASKLEACAQVAIECSKTDGEEYQRLYREKLEEIQQKDNIQVSPSLQPLYTKSSNIAVWVGGSLFQSYPKHYVDQRRRWQESLQRADWETLEALVTMDYEWSLNDWLNVGDISEDGKASQWSGFTTLHVLASRQPPSPLDRDSYQAWNRLLHRSAEPCVWKSIRSFDVAARTAEELALKNGHEDMALMFRPKFIHYVANHFISSLESQFHGLMREYAGEFVEDYEKRVSHAAIVRSFGDGETRDVGSNTTHVWGEFDLNIWHSELILFERKGFLIRLSNDMLHVSIFETVLGGTRPKRTDLDIRAETAL